MSGKAAGEVRGAGARIARNTVVLVTIRVIVPLLSVALMVVLSRALGVEGIGRYSLAYGYLYLFNTIAPLGLYAVITRDGARDRADLERMLANAFSFGTASSLLLTGVMALMGRALGYDGGTQAALALLALAILPYTLGEFIQGAAIAIERTEYVAAVTLTEYTFKVGLGVLLLLNGHGLEAVLAVAVAGRALGCLVGALLLRRAGVRVSWGLDRGIARRLLSLTPTFTLIAVFATLYWRIDILMLSKLRSMEDVGHYGAAWRILEFAMVVPTSLCLSLYPRIAVLIGDRTEELARLARTAMRYLVALTLPVAVALTLLGEPVLVLAYGEPFREAARTLTVLIWALLPYNLVRYHAYVIVAADRQRVDLALNILMAMVNVGLNLLLIPAFGHLGAAWATLVSICVYATLQQVYVRARLPGRAAGPVLQPVVILASALTAVVIFLTANVPIVALVVSPPVYLCVLYLGGFFTAGELRLFGLERLVGSSAAR